MSEGIFITVADSRNHYDDFVGFMNATTDALRKDGKARSEYYVTRNGDKLEKDVLDCMKSKAMDFRFNPELISHTLPQHFPDIISNHYFGVEVKSTKNNSWQSTGSSIVESLRDDDIKKVFMLFGILSKDNIDFRCKPYERCLSEIAVTHSPRYLINMDLSDKDQTIFDKMKIDYDTFRNLGESQIDKVREYYRGKYKSKNAKSMPWWIGESTELTEENSTSATEFELRLLSDIEETRRSFYITRCYAIFPEILGKDQDKFRKPALWMCTRYSIICSNIRDQFTAGGTGNIYVGNILKWKDVPKVICNLLPCLQQIKGLYATNIGIRADIEDFAVFSTKLNAGLEEWIKAANIAMHDTLGDKHKSLTIEELLNYRFVCKRKDGSKDCFYLK